MELSQDVLKYLEDSFGETMELLETMAECAKADGCTKTNPIIPSIEQFKDLFVKAYKG